MPAGVTASLSLPAVAFILGAYVIVMLAMTRRSAATLDAERFVVADRDVPGGVGAASMAATWIWAASMYAAATAAYTYGVAGAFHYAFWGGLALLFVWRYGQRVRRLVPHGHTFSQFIRARHGRLSQGVMGLEGYLNSQYSLVVNFTAAGALLSSFSSLPYEAAVVVVALTVLAYSTISGIRASVVTDLVQMAAIVLLAAAVVPLIVVRAGGPAAVATGLTALEEPAASTFWSPEAFLGQGAPMMALVLAYSFANPTVWQRIWTVRERDLRRVYVTSGLLYMSVVFAIGTLGVVALGTGVAPANGDLNTVVPAVARAYLPAAMVVPFVVLILAAVTSTSDSDLAALSSIAMADIWQGYVNPWASDRQLLAVGRLSMILVTAVAVAVALLRFDILALILFYGMIRAASVFPIAASIVWERVSNLAFSAAVVSGIAMGTAVRLGTIPGADGASTVTRTAVAAVVVSALSAVGAATVAGALAFPFVRWHTALPLGGVVGIVVFVAQMLNAPGLLGYPALASTLVALGTGTVVCAAISLAGHRQFDWNALDRRVRPFTGEAA